MYFNIIQENQPTTDDENRGHQSARSGHGDIQRSSWTGAEDTALVEFISLYKDE